MHTIEGALQTSSRLRYNCNCLVDICYRSIGISILDMLSREPDRDHSLFYAHTLPAPASMDEWETIDAHLDKVALLAGEFCSAFGARAWGDTLGRLHDLGKFSKDFQDYLRRSADADASEEHTKPGRVDHSTFGARYATQHAGTHTGQLLAYCVAGHHAGLPDWTAEHAESERSTLKFRLFSPTLRIPPVDESLISTKIQNLKLPIQVNAPHAGFQLAFFARMIFSALVDADRLATEAFCNPSDASLRSACSPRIHALSHTFSDFVDAITTSAKATPVNVVRADVLAQCRNAAKEVPGFFSLTVPTGGGKTLSSMDFALRHAAAHRLRRVIVAVPFTTIIEQTADVYRSALGEYGKASLLEHHSNIEPSKDTLANKLATENWDSPIILTTNVQFFESLFASSTTPCRKLHRIANSVIVLDEVQTLPVEFLQPTLQALRELVLNYGCSVVLCTATQPALEKEDTFTIGLENVRPIVRDVPKLFQLLKRVRVQHAGQLDDLELSERLAGESSALCIVNTRRHAASLFDTLHAMRPEGLYHLSTNMCAMHRRDVLAEIRQRLKSRQVCRVVSTQLVEAGVDLDFDVVYRAPAGFDSIAQAAGRCNREGHLTTGSVWLFDTALPPPPGMLRLSAQIAREVAEDFPDPLDPDAIRAYFRMLYWQKESLWDTKKILSCFRASPQQTELVLQFRNASRDYRWIADTQTQVLVVHDEISRNLRDHMIAGDTGGFIDFRVAQRYLVGVYPDSKHELAKLGAIEEHKTGSGLWLLCNDRAYTRDKGLSAADGKFMAEDLVI